MEPATVIDRIERLTAAQRAALRRRLQVLQAGADDASGESSRARTRLVAYVAANEHVSGLTDDLKTTLRQQLPEYMVPQLFVPVTEIPHLPNGKVDVDALVMPEDAFGHFETPFAGPQSETEETIASIWSSLFGMDEISIHDDFFEIGGDSIVSMQFVSRAREAGLDLSPYDVVRDPTIASLAACADGRNFPTEDGGQSALDETGVIDARPTVTGSPASGIEAELMEACAVILGHEGASLEDTFFQAGGDAVTCVPFVARLKERGIDIEAGDVDSSTTIRALARIVERRSRTDFRTEVLRRGTGTGTVVFACPYGDHPWYRERMSGDLDARLSQIAIVASTRPDTDRFESVQAIAKAQARCVVEYDAEGPHVVIGFCWGGTLAFEIARELSILTQRDPCLVLIESMVDPDWYGAGRTELMCRYLGGLVLRTQRAVRKRGPAAIGKAIWRRLTQRLLPPSPAGPSATNPAPKWNSEQTRLIELLNDYRPAPWGGNLYLLQGHLEERLVLNVYADSRYGWQNLITGQLETRSVEGEHLSCLNSAAEELNRVIGEHLMQV